MSIYQTIGDSELTIYVKKKKRSAFGIEKVCLER